MSGPPSWLVGAALVLGVFESVASAADVDGGAAAPRQGSAPSLEGFAFSGPSLVGGDPAVPESTESFRRVGIYGELGVAFRSSYFLDPFFSVGYATLASGDTELPDGAWGEGGTLSQRLDTWHLSPGVTADLFRLRLRLGLGVLVVVQRYGFRDDDTVTTQVPIAGQVGLGFNLYDSPSVRLDVESKFVHAAGAEISFGVLGATLRGDLVTFH